MELHYKDISPLCRSPLCVAKVLGLKVTLRELVNFEDLRSDWFLKLNPAHQIPVLNDNGFPVSESRAIMTYLVNQYAPGHALYPLDAKARARIDRVLYYDATSFWPALKENYTPRMFKKEPTDEQKESFREAIRTIWALKGDNKFLAGDNATLADMSIVMNHSFVKIFFPPEAEMMQEWVNDVEDAIPEVKEIQDPIDFSYLKKLLEDSSK